MCMFTDVFPADVLSPPMVHTYLPLIVLPTSIAELQNEVQAITAEYRQEQADHKQVQHVRKREG